MADQPKRMTRSVTARCFTAPKECSIRVDRKDVKSYSRIVRNASGEWLETIFLRVWIRHIMKSNKNPHSPKQMIFSGQNVWRKRKSTSDSDFTFAYWVQWMIGRRAQNRRIGIVPIHCLGCLRTAICWVAFEFAQFTALFFWILIEICWQ